MRGPGYGGYGGFGGNYGIRDVMSPTYFGPVFGSSGPAFGGCKLLIMSHVMRKPAEFRLSLH